MTVVISWLILCAPGRQRWKGQDSDGNNVDIQYNGIVGNIGISSEGDETVFFVAPGL